MDANAFRRADLSNMMNLPPPESISWEGVLHGHYFNTGTTRKRVAPRFRVVQSSDPLSGSQETWLTFGLNSCFDGKGLREKGRLPCNAVFVVDVSGSMQSAFPGESGTKLRAAQDALTGMLDLFSDDDTVAILAFDTVCTVEVPLVRLGSSAVRERVCAGIRALTTRGGTSFMAGFDKAMAVIDDAEETLLATTAPWTPRVQMEIPPAARRGAHFLLWALRNARPGLSGHVVDQLLGFLDVRDVAWVGGEVPASTDRRALTETRVFFMTDMNINQGDRSSELLVASIEEAAVKRGVMTTIVGIGVDFNVELTDRLACVRGANYFTAHSTEEFLRQMCEELGFLMAPLAFDLTVHIEGEQGSVPRTEHVYGAPEPKNMGPRPAGTLCRVNTFFPSATDDLGHTKGSMILCRLSHWPVDGRLVLVTSFSPRCGGTREETRQEVGLSLAADAASVKSIALVRYVNAVRCYLSDMRQVPASPTTNMREGIAHPPTSAVDDTSQEGRQHIGHTYAEVFHRLSEHLASIEIQLKALNDPDCDLSERRVELQKLDKGCSSLLENPACSICSAHPF